MVFLSRSEAHYLLQVHYYFHVATVLLQIFSFRLSISDLRFYFKFLCCLLFIFIFDLFIFHEKVPERAFNDMYETRSGLGK